MRISGRVLTQYDLNVALSQHSEAVHEDLEQAARRFKLSMRNEQHYHHHNHHRRGIQGQNAQQREEMGLLSIGDKTMRGLGWRLV